MTTLIRAALAAAALAAPLAALASAFGVTPIRVDLDPGSRTAIVNVTNDETRKLYFQVKLARWTQDPATGEDRYEDSGELVYFPQLLVVDPKQRRIVRIGLKGPAPAAERAFRLFIEELPDPNDKGAVAGAQIAVRLRFGVPIFATSGKGEPRAAIVAAQAKAGEARLEIRNDGERSVRFEAITVMAGERTVGKTNGWYVFPGTARHFSVPVDRSACPIQGPVELHAVVGSKSIRRPLEGANVLCGS